jgi:hypothetical protein
MAGGEMTNPVYETMTCLRTGHYDIRVWREEPAFKMGPDEEVVEVFSMLPAPADGKHLLGREIVKALGQLPRITAIEVLVTKTRDGGLFYPDWK